VASGFGKSAVMEAQLLYTPKPKLFDSTHRGNVGFIHE
jgi:hypothetical protein